MNPNLDLDQLRSQLSLTKAPLVMKNLEVVVDFFKKTLRVSPFSWIPYLKGIDFSKPVEPVQLHPGCEVVRHKPDDSKPKPFCYLTVVGSSPMRTGTNFANVTFERFQVCTPTAALASFASSISFGPADRTSRPGGAKQFIISAPDFARLRKL